MGILDKKTRIMDTILTLEGRNQIAHGKLKAAFYSFTDGGIFYQGDIVSGSADTNSIFMLEATNLPQDQITFEADDSGRLVAYRGSNTIVRNGQIISGSSMSSTGEILVNDDFNSAADMLLSSSVDNFNRLCLLGSPDPFDNSFRFLINKSSINFTISEQLPISPAQIKTISINDAESLFMDKRLSHIPNFAYLPPVNKPASPSATPTSLGNFPRLNQAPILTIEQLDTELAVLRRNGYEETIQFTETSLQNNLVGQFFELTNNGLSKLDVIDFGSFLKTEDEFPSKHVFFVGKVFNDDYGTDTFINLFILIFES